MAEPAPSFSGFRVLLLESRRSRELAAIVSSYGGAPVAAPAMREVPIESNTEALAAADALVEGQFDLVILLTGVGTRALVQLYEQARGSREPLVRALQATRVAARGPKPLAVLRELGVPAWVAAAEPNTWKELLAALDAKASERPLQGCRVAVQEYGESNPDLLDGLAARGAVITRIPVYQWALPEDLGPLRAAIRLLADGMADVVLFTTATQVVHLMQVAADMGLADAVRDGLRRAVVASIGPTTSDMLRRYGLGADLEPSHPKMGFLVREAAARSPGLLRSKRG